MRDTVTVCCSFIFNFKSILSGGIILGILSRKWWSPTKNHPFIYCAVPDNVGDSLQANIYFCWPFDLDDRSLCFMTHTSPRVRLSACNEPSPSTSGGEREMSEGPNQQGGGGVDGGRGGARSRAIERRNDATCLHLKRQCFFLCKWFACIDLFPRSLML